MTNTVRIRRRWSRIVMVATLLTTMTTPLLKAQGGPPDPPIGQPPMGPPSGAPGRGGRGGGAGEDDSRRALLERRFQERLLVIVRQRLALNDDQTSRLREVASRAEDERRALRRDELTARFAMRQELLAAERANEAKVADLLEQMPRLERRRLELMEREQRELAKFLTPLQRARYFSLQDELRRGLQELQQGRMASPDSAGRPVLRGRPAPLTPRRLNRRPPD
jgi:Spy/CpxP family protein refolding chaperone